MGIIQHDAVIACLLAGEQVDKVKAWIGGLEPQDQERFLWSPQVTNFTVTVVLVPDGSKEYWEESDRWNDIRAEFIALLRTGFSYEPDWAHVSFGELGRHVEGDGDGLPR
jgi:hypothetical protein